MNMARNIRFAKHPGKCFRSAVAMKLCRYASNARSGW